MTRSLSASASRAAPLNQPSTFSFAAPPRQTTRAAPPRIRRAIGRRCGSYFQMASMSLYRSVTAYGRPCFLARRAAIEPSVNSVCA